MRAFERVSLRQELDERLLPFRMVKRRKLKAGWVRSVRLATGNAGKGAGGEDGCMQAGGSAA
jgi:hypothetical protein